MPIFILKLYEGILTNEFRIYYVLSNDQWFHCLIYKVKTENSRTNENREINDRSMSCMKLKTNCLWTAKVSQVHHKGEVNGKSPYCIKLERYWFKNEKGLEQEANKSYMWVWKVLCAEIDLVQNARCGCLCELTAKKNNNI